MKKKDRSISTTDTSILITKAGGRCSYNFEGEYCNKILSDGRVNLGERAHIVGVKGPRANMPLNGDLNGYDNLIWLCRDHHKIIDHPSNLHIYSVTALHDMKSRHEQKVLTGCYPFYGSEESIHDYSILSILFYYIEVHQLYGSVSKYPVVDLNFFTVSDMLSEFKAGNPGALPLKDLVLRKAFINFERSHTDFANHLRTTPYSESHNIPPIFTWNFSYRGENLASRYLHSVEYLIGLIQKRFPQILNQEIFDPGM